MSETLIHLDGVKKIFYTDEVETHALAGIHAIECAKQRATDEGVPQAKASRTTEAKGS